MTSAVYHSIILTSTDWTLLAACGPLHTLQLQNNSSILMWVLGACRAAKRVKGPKTGGAPKQSKGPSSSSPQNYKSAGPVKEG